jgi:hypothetical protein
LQRLPSTWEVPAHGFPRCGCFFADEFVRHTVGTYTSKQLPQQEIVLKVVRAALNDLKFFFRPTPLGFRQVVPHARLHGAYYLIHFIKAVTLSIFIEGGLQKLN